MTSISVRCRMKPYIQPFERALALAELDAVSGGGAVSAPSDHCSSCVDVRTSAPVETLAASLAYWETVDDGVARYTRQALREATVSVARNGTSIDRFSTALPFRNDVPLANRRCLRYATHGLHEYRGKFFPQLVKALINIGRVPVGGVVADPMCGSGTTLVESVLAGRTAIGLDMNPLSVRLSRAKCMLLHADPERLRRAARSVESRLAGRRNGDPDELRYFGEIPVADQEYLRRWFSAAALKDLDAIVAAIRPVRDAAAREMLFIALSKRPAPHLLAEDGRSPCPKGHGEHSGRRRGCVRGRGAEVSALGRSIPVSEWTGANRRRGRRSRGRPALDSLVAGLVSEDRRGRHLASVRDGVALSRHRPVESVLPGNVDSQETPRDGPPDDRQSRDHGPQATGVLGVF